MILDFIDPVIFCFSVFDRSQHAFRLLDIVMFLLFSRMKSNMFHIYTFHTIFSRNCKLIKCDPLCEIQAKVSKSNYEITSIKVGFQPFISL